MTNPVTLDPAFVAAKVTATLAIVEQARALTGDQLEACMVMLRNTRSTEALEDERAEEDQAWIALAAVGLLELAQSAIDSASAAIPTERSNHMAWVAAGLWVRRAILGACLDGLPVLDDHLVARLCNPWRTVISH